MKKTIIFPLLLLTFSAAGLRAEAACAGKTNQDSAAVKSAIQTVNRNYGQAFATGDSSLFLSSYTPDACLMPAGTPIISGVSGQLAFYRFAYKSGVRNIVFSTIALYGLTDIYATEQGVYEMFDGQNNSLGKGKYLVLWKNTASGWRMYRDIFNPDSPAPRRSK
jgi:ketosteroid isomerase-like protein